MLKAEILSLELKMAEIKRMVEKVVKEQIESNNAVLWEQIETNNQVLFERIKKHIKNLRRIDGLQSRGV